MALSPEDRIAIASSARRLGLDPHSFGALMHLESGIDPNRWGGAGGQYVGLIQFGPGARKEVGLPGGRMTVAQQLPYVEKYFQQRGYKPGDNPAENITRAYRTVLVGNPWDSGTDSFGTNSDKAARRMLPGGDLYKAAAQKLGGLDDLPATGGGSASTPVTATGGQQVPSRDSDLADALFGGSPAPQKAEAEGSDSRLRGLRFADMGATPDGLMTSVEPGRMAGAKLEALTAENDPFVAAFTPKESPAPAQQSTAESRPAVDPGAGAMDSLFGGSTAAAQASKGQVGGELLDGEVGLVPVGRQLQKLGFRVAENPHFGDGRVGKHSPNSHHYSGNAIDLTIQPGSPLLAGRKDGEWRSLTSQWGQKLKAAFPDAEIFYPGGDPVGGHDSHIHMAFPGGRLRPSKLARQLGLA